MIQPEERIRATQAAVIVSNLMLGAGILTLPRSVLEKTHTPDAWIAVLLAGALALLGGCGIALLSRRYPGQTVYEFAGRIVGRVPGFVLSALIVVYFLGTAAFQVRSMSEVSAFFLLEGTPSWVITAIFLWVGLYLTAGGIGPIARLFEIILPVTVAFLALLSVLSLRIFEPDHIRPILGEGIAPVLHGLKAASLAYSGPEIMLILTAYMRSPKQAVKAVAAGILVPIAIYAPIVFITIGALSVEGTLSRTWPTIDLIRSFEIGGLIFERFESLLLITWILQIFSSFTIAYYAASLGLSRLLGGKSWRLCLYALLPIVYLLIRAPRNIREVFGFGDVIGDCFIWMFGALPWALLIISVCKEKWNAKGQPSS